ncbi:MAG: hypothetical protein ACRCT1_06070 [Microcoleaceae cyanobacterium]
MPKQTEKFVKAVAIAGTRFRNTSHEALYQLMSEAQYYWDSRSRTWVHTPSESNDPPTTLHRVRVWAAKGEVESLATAIIQSLTAQGYRLDERSAVYPCRPPKGNEARIYLSFIPPQPQTVTVAVEAVPQPGPGDSLGPRPGDMVMGGGRASGR